ncbi:class I SAM-dependent methyltransferase [Oxobacter pfennigii]|uniref:class I SAM-dependent methyltransferase n=1 Tax=Oxobacter pfennigii TaxID=36849 RepID=UPI001FA7C35A|nr:class I SAM-dependent methyltransferase [Oxobacter pfennigii]
MKFDEDVLNYDKHRPTYGTEIFNDIIRYSNLDNTKKALEIGIGTGQATLPILKTGCRVTAVEIGGSMTAYVKQKFSSFNNFAVKNIEFEKYDAENNRYDLVYSATAFHWIQQDIGLAKVFELLKSGGAIALFWNHPFVNRENDMVHSEIQKIYRKYMPANKTHAEFDESTCKQHEGSLKSYGFKDINTKIYKKTRVLNTEQYISLLNTYSDHRALQDDIIRRLLNEISIAIDKYNGRITIYDTIDLYLARKP